MAKNGHSNFFPTIFPKKTGTNLEWMKWPFQIFSDKFSQKDWYKFRMAKNGHSKFFLTIFCKKTGINLEWPKMAIPNLLKPFWYKITGRNLEWSKMGILNLFEPF